MRREFLKNALSIIEFNDKSWIVDQEIEDMLKGDIPYFQFHMGSGEILNSRGKPLETFYKRTGMEFIGNQIQNRTLEDLRVQKQLIETALTYSRAAFLKTIYPGLQQRISKIFQWRICAQRLRMWFMSTA